MKDLFITRIRVDVRPGTLVDESSEEIAKLAKKTDAVVSALVGDVEYVAKPGMTAEEVKKAHDKAFKKAARGRKGN